MSQLIWEHQKNDFINAKYDDSANNSIIFIEMAQNNYIRPLTTNYHDFTERKVQQTDFETPYKFRRQDPQVYVKKPKRNPVIHPPPQPQLPAQKTPTCCQKYCGCFLNGFDFCNFNSKDKKIGNCCFACRCFQPQICANCVSKICKQCLQKMCLKFRLCNPCLNVLCSGCRANVYDVSCGSCCSSAPKLRQYPIRIKNKNNLHFQGCNCVDCVKHLEQQRNRMQKIIQKPVEMLMSMQELNRPPTDMREMNDNPAFGKNKGFEPVESEVHYVNK